jgi:hypothetical protein
MLYAGHASVKVSSNIDLRATDCLSNARIVRYRGCCALPEGREARCGSWRYAAHAGIAKDYKTVILT